MGKGYVCSVCFQSILNCNSGVPYSLCWLGQFFALILQKMIVSCSVMTSLTCKRWLLILLPCLPMAYFYCYALGELSLSLHQHGRLLFENWVSFILSYYFPGVMYLEPVKITFYSILSLTCQWPIRIMRLFSSFYYLPIMVCCNILRSVYLLSFSS